LAKVSDKEGDDLLFKGDGLEIRAMKRTNGRLPAKEWVQRLDGKGTALFHAAATVLATNLRSGRDGGRAERIKNARHKLWELKVTKPGSSPPHHRLIFLREGTILWATHGFTKQKNKLPPPEIEQADRIADEWTEERAR
jgi:hypothetical protein